MTDNISREAVEKVAKAITAANVSVEVNYAYACPKTGESKRLWEYHTRAAEAATSALLSTGEVVLRKDVEELVEALRKIGIATIVSFDSEKEAVEKMHSAPFWESIAVKMQKIAWEAIAKFKEPKQ